MLVKSENLFLSSRMAAKVTSSLVPGKGQSGKTRARTEARGSGKGEGKEMSSVCEGSRPRDGAIKNHRAKSACTTHRVDSLTEWSLSLILSFLLSFWRWGKLIPNGRLVTHAHVEIRFPQLEEKVGFCGANTETQPGDATFTLSLGLRPRSPLFRLNGGRVQQTGADLTTKPGCHRLISGR